MFSWRISYKLLLIMKFGINSKLCDRVAKFLSKTLVTGRLKLSNNGWLTKNDLKMSKNLILNY